MYIKWLKCIIDFIGVLMAVFVLNWLLLLTVVSIKLTLKGSVFYEWRRIDKGKKEIQHTNIPNYESISIH